jgi:hypothetical protein
MFHKFFSRWGDGFANLIVRDKGTGVSKNLRFVKIEPSDLGTALELDGIEVGERLTVVKKVARKGYALSRSRRPHGRVSPFPPPPAKGAAARRAYAKGGRVRDVLL